jgi:hypothetical protein
VFVGSLSLFWTRACVGESLGSLLFCLFLYVLILSMLARNAFIYVHLNFIGANQLLAVQRCASWSLEPVGTVGQVLNVFG